MILVAGIASEPPLAAVLERLDHLGADVLVLHQRDLEGATLTWRAADGRIEGLLELPSGPVDLASVDAVYARLMDHRLLPELEHEPVGSARSAAAQRFHEALIGWIDVVPARVVNRFRAMGSNGSKPYQASIIRRYGFDTPDTLVSNDPVEVRAFVAHHGRVIYKSASGVRSIVTEVGADDLARLDDVRACPVQFQAHVPGYDVRVHTVGAEVLATRVDSSGTDYRYAGHHDGGTRLEPYELPGDLAERCVRLAAALDLAFAGIDLRISPEGVTCFEVNPCPAYSYYEAHTGQAISLALAHHLMGAT